MSQIFKVEQIFKPGGIPEYTYIKREDESIEEKLRNVKYMNKFLMVTGATKLGKTVLVKKIYSEEHAIWINCGELSQDNVNAFWDTLRYKLSIPNNVTKKEALSGSAELSNELSFNAQFAAAKGGTKVGAGLLKEESLFNDLSAKTYIIDNLIRSRKVLILDDFHYLTKNIQANVVTSLKAAVQDGLCVIILAIPQRKNDIEDVERELRGRVEKIIINYWSKEELIKIANNGFDLLNLQPKREFIQKCVNNSFGSPHLMQEFCLKLCIYGGFHESQSVTGLLDFTHGDNGDRIFKNASQSAEQIFNALKQGPPTRGMPRNQYLTKNGKQIDMYTLVLYAIAKIKPNLNVISYNALRIQISNILVDNDIKINQIERVFDSWREIQRDKDDIVIQSYRDERNFLIMDPMFCLYLYYVHFE